MIRPATIHDLDRIEEIYNRIHDEEEAGRMTTGWSRNIYPVRQTAYDAIQRKDMFVETDNGGITAAAIINRQQVPEYADCTWEYDAPEEAVMVLHTLVVDPFKKGMGYGRTFVRFYEQYALEQGCKYLRLDTQVKNTDAQKLYFKLGYKTPGTVNCTFNGIPNVQLMCLEKKL